VKAARIFETCLYANDLAAAERFYSDVLGLEVVSRNEGRGVVFRCGPGVLLVFDARQTRIPGGRLPTHGADGPGHVAFLARESELDAWRQQLQRLGIPIEKEVDWPEGGHSLYFRDPAGNVVELAPPTLWGFGGVVPP
jgi:catechol 2,3-dioxygenase-like lactoylglutathione lyase family enzyme